MKRDDMGVAAQQFVHAPLLDPPAFSVDDAHRRIPRLDARFDVILDQGRDLLRSERVQIDDVLNRDSDRLQGVGHGISTAPIEKTHFKPRSG